MLILTCIMIIVTDFKCIIKLINIQDVTQVSQTDTI